MSTANLEIVSPLTAQPVVVVDGTLLEAVAKLKATSLTLTVTDPASAQAARALLKNAKDTRIAIEKAREAVKAPLIELGRKIDAAAKAPQADLSAAEMAVQRVLNDWVRAEEEKARRAREEAERKQRELEAERRRIEEQERRERAERERLAAEENRKLEQAGSMVDVEIEDEPQPEPVKPVVAAPVVVAQPSRAAAVGLQMRYTLEVRVVDLTQVPEKYLRPRELNLSAVKASFCQPWKDGDAIPTVPGLKFERTGVAR